MAFIVLLERQSHNRSSAPPPFVGFNTEKYGVIQEVGFASVRNAPLSTYSIDIDTASYANLRRFLRDRTPPPPDQFQLTAPASGGGEPGVSEQSVHDIGPRCLVNHS